MPPALPSAASALPPGTAAVPGEHGSVATPAHAERDARLASHLAATAAGDAGAFEAFYEGTFAFARTVARRLLRDNAEVEDLLADCYFEAWRTAARFDPARGSPVTWLLTIVRSRGLDALRAAAARPQRAGMHPASEAGAEGAPDAIDTETAAGSEADPAEQLWRRQSGTALHAALATLSAPERWVLGLAYLRELSHAEIADCTGMPLGTVKSHALRAQHKLRMHMSALSGPQAADALGRQASSTAAAGALRAAS